MRPLVRWRFERGDLRMLFIVGHMRSGSTLLVHLLASNPEIVGFGEAHLSYGNGSDPARRAVTIFRRCGMLWPRGKYVMDKVLHKQRKRLSTAALQAMDARTILLVRRPETALRSILGLRLRSVRTEMDALEYYVERLNAVKELARELGPHRCTFLTYERLVEQTALELGSLTSFLRLKVPLKGEYDLMWSTGKMWIGDPSKRIKAGRILAQEREYRHDVSQHVLSPAAEAYDDCVAYCSRVLGVGDRLGVN